MAQSETYGALCNMTQGAFQDAPHAMAQDAHAPHDMPRPQNAPDADAAGPHGADPMPYDGPHDDIVSVEVEGATVDLLGTAHVSRASTRAVRDAINSGRYDVVGVELCPRRLRAMTAPDEFSRQDLWQILRAGRGWEMAAQLALTAYQQRLAEQLGVEAGGEMRAAVRAAAARELPLETIDRDIGVTFKRLSRRTPFWRRWLLLQDLALALLSRAEVTEEQIERLKHGSVLHECFGELLAARPEAHEVLVRERDLYMAARIRETLRARRPRRMLAVMGAGHLDGVRAALEAPPEQLEAVAALDAMPPRARWPQALPWAIAALIITGFVIGFQRGIGWSLALDWALINGGLAAVGALLAGAHWVTVAAAFVAAPFTSINPMVGAGMVAAFVELWVKRPRALDFERLRDDITQLSGWRHNRVARTLLIFMLCTLGSAIGTYVGGFHIYSVLE